MAKIIVIFALIWLGWAVFKSVLEEIQGRAEDRRAKEEGETSAQDVPAGSKAASTDVAAFSPSVPNKWQPRQQTGGTEKNELERLLIEALERKRQLEKEPAPKPASPAVRPQTESIVHGESAEKIPHRSPDLRLATPEFRPVSMRAEPVAEHRHKPEVMHRHVAQPRKQFVPAPPMRKGEAPSSVTAPRREKAGHKVAHAVRRMEGMGGLHLDDIRTGIIIAEILGPPKGLGGIDSRVM